MELDPELLDVFLVESNEQLTSLEQSLLELERGGGNTDVLNTIFRMAHTLKGNAACMGMTRLSESAHVVEDVLGALRQGQIAVSSELVTLLLQAVDAFRQMVRQAGQPEAAGPNNPGDASTVLFARIGLFAGGGLFVDPKPAVKTASAPDEHAEHDAADEPLTGKMAVLEQPAQVSSRTLRVKVDKLDRMLDLTSEIAIARGRLRELLKPLAGSAAERAVEAFVDLERLSLDLQEQVRRTRMVPLEPLFNQYRRVTREVAASCGKQAALSLHGEDVEVDTSIIELLRDPLTHMVRNAIDHGIEAPALRLQRGKPVAGNIDIAAYHEGSSVVIEVRDDGAGIDSARVAAKARALGMDLPDPPTERALLALILEPGFSTNQAVTELSGRGVGMDVVRRNVEALRGVLTIDTRLGFGTTITLRLPLTLAIIDGLVVGVGAETYVIPMDAVIECVDAPTASATAMPAVLQMRDQAVPCLELRDLLAVDAAPAARRSIVVIVDQGRNAGLIVDRLIGQGQVVVKPLGQVFRTVPGVAASTILGSGRVALILDIPALLRDAANRQSSPRLRHSGSASTRPSREIQHVS